MRTRHPLAWGAAAIVLLATPAVLAGQDSTAARTAAATSAADSAVRTAPVTYVAGSTIYVAAGRADGLVEGQQLFIKRQNGTSVTLKVAFLSSRQASCEVVGEAASVVVGEQVTFTPKAASSAAKGSTAVAARRPSRHRLNGPGLHGRVGARYLVAKEETLNGGFSQPSFDLRLDGSQLGGTPLGLNADLRTRRTTSTASDGSSTVDGRTRVYQAALLWNTPGAGFRMALGRQYLTAVTSVTLFDGALLELNSSHFGFGAFGGVEPEPANLGFSRDIQDYGGYFQLHNKPGNLGVWSFSLGAVGSYSSVATNREFGFAQATVSTPVISLFALQELDYYRPWKVRQGEDKFSLTSTYVNGSLRPSRWLAFNGGYDSRRSVRLFRDAVDPATQFDDTYRRGVNGGISLMGNRVRASADWRRSDGGGNGTATAWTGTAGLDRFTPLHLSLTGRATWYSNPALDGRLYSGRLGFDPLTPLHIEFNGGVRNEDLAPTELQPATTHHKVTWIGADLDWSLARGWFLSLSATREKGEAATTQFYGSMTWRF
ncbi:MAG TPA: hypothetical protein VLD58_08565 [Gemmatimonadales bacterium]|nr:hypothetical protein [Gemmatimonadales bacterium]